MIRRSLLAAAVAYAVLALTSCSTVITALLVKQLLDDKAPRYKWTGVVEDTTGDPVEDVKVEVRGAVSGDSDIATFSDTTDNTGSYSITYRYNGEVSYSIRVTKDGQVLSEQTFGKVEKGDKTTNFTINGTVNATISGVIEDTNGDPLEGVLVIAGSTDSLDEVPDVLHDAENQIRYDLSGESGIYQLEGAIGSYAVVCAYHPDHGFAYAVGQDTDHDGSVAMNIKMGTSGEHQVQVRVVDGNGDPIAVQVLSAARQFRLRMDTPFNLGTSVDEIVNAEALFPGLVGVPSDSHPQAETLTVQATGLNGIATDALTVAGSTYDLTLLNIGEDTTATALVNSDNPLPVDGTEVVEVRVN